MSGDKSKVEAIFAALSTSALGYNFLDNPDGFVVAVLLDNIVGWIEGVAESVASTIATTIGILATTVVDALGVAVLPFEIVGDLATGFVEQTTALAVDLASALGPLGFVAIPVVWGSVTVVLTASAIGIWRAYKWIRTVVA